MYTAPQDNDMGDSPMPMDTGGDSMPAADTAADTDTPTDQQPEDQGSGIIHIPGDMLPESIRGKCKAGDKLTFEVVGPADAEGDLPVEFESGAGYSVESPEEEANEPWENSFRKAMSPRSEDEGSPMPQSLEEQGY
jgi:hypothetical protein